MGMTEQTAALQDVRVAREEYMTIAEQHDQFLRRAEGASYGSAEMRNALRCANDLGPHVAMALRRYLDAIEVLTVFSEQARPANTSRSVAQMPSATATTAPHTAYRRRPMQSRVG
jgi:hypothetical protein